MTNNQEFYQLFSEKEKANKNYRKITKAINKLEEIELGRLSFSAVPRMIKELKVEQQEYFKIALDYEKQLLKLTE